MRLLRILAEFWGDQRGNFAMITALGAVPLVGVAGLAVDYSRATNAGDFLQGHSDAIALAVASRGPERDSSDLMEAMAGKANADSNFGEVAFDGSWMNASDYQVKATMKLPLTFSAILPNVGSSLDVRAEAVARFQGAKYYYKPPTFAEVAPEAGDYNRITAYCYSQSTGRSQFVDIADNVGTKYKNVTMPLCKAGEVLSYKLTNVEWGKQDGNWKSKLKKYGKTREEDSHIDGYGGIYYYYSDTTITGGVEKYDLGGNNILETILCDTSAQCKPKNQGGILPNNTERNRQYTRSRATRPCERGKYMYYGWEDRVPGTRGSDADFDDIRLVIECPEVVIEQNDNVSLVQ